MPKTKILVVEDETIIAMTIEDRLNSLGYTVLDMVHTGEKAVQQAGELQPDLVLMDITLKGKMDGVEAAAQIRARFDIPVIYLTAYADEDTLQRAKVAEPFGYLLKPLGEREMHTAIKMALYKHQVDQKLRQYQDHLEKLVAERTAELARSNEQLEREIVERTKVKTQLQQANSKLIQAYHETLAGWSRAIALRDQETEEHSQRVTEMTVDLARAMGIGEDELVHIRRGALLHDVGKMGVPDDILLKPGPLTDEEWQIMRQHPTYAYQMLSPITHLHPALDIPYCHHEKWDGTGYPRGLKEEEIPLAARIFAIADVWDALCSDRSYHNAWTEEEVRAFIRKEAGRHFDPRVVDVFLQILETEH